MVLDKHLLGVTPKSLDSVDVDLSPGKAFVMVQAMVPVAMVDQGIIRGELVRVDDGCVVYLLDCQVLEGFVFEVWKEINRNQPITLQDAEYCYFSGCSSSSFSFPPSSEISFVYLHLTAQKERGVMGMSHDCGADGGDGLVGRPIGQSYFLADSPCGSAQVEELDQPQPLYATQAALVDPAPTEEHKSKRNLASMCKSYRTHGFTGN